jgi:hypothetical protein
VPGARGGFWTGCVPSRGPRLRDAQMNAQDHALPRRPERRDRTTPPWRPRRVPIGI